MKTALVAPKTKARVWSGQACGHRNAKGRTLHRLPLFELRGPEPRHDCRQEGDAGEGPPSVSPDCAHPLQIMRERLQLLRRWPFLSRLSRGPYFADLRLNCGARVSLNGVQHRPALDPAMTIPAVSIVAFDAVATSTDPAHAIRQARMTGVRGPSRKTKIAVIGKPATKAENAILAICPPSATERPNSSANWGMKRPRPTSAGLKPIAVARNPAIVRRSAEFNAFFVLQCCTS